MKKTHYFLDLSDDGHWIISNTDGKNYSAGYNKQKVMDLILRLNRATNPVIEQRGFGNVYVFWNDNKNESNYPFVKEI